jgi:hypothetical protein
MATEGERVMVLTTRGATQAEPAAAGDELSSFKDLSGSTSRAAYYCAAEVVRERRRRGEPIPAWLRQHYAELDAAVRASMSQPGHESPVQPAQLEGEWITARQAADILRRSAKQVHRLRADLGAQLIGGRWLFRRTTVLRYGKERDAGSTVGS